MKDLGINKLCIVIEGARNLRNADHGFNGNFSDPFCQCEVVGKPLLKFRSHVVQDTLNPNWNYAFTISGYDAGDDLMFTVFDRDIGASGDALGTVVLSGASLPAEGFSGELQLTDDLLKKKKPHHLPPVLRVKIIAPQMMAAQHVDPKVRLFPTWTKECSNLLETITVSRLTCRDIGGGLPRLQRTFTHIGHMMAFDLRLSRCCRARLFNPEATSRICWDVIGLIALMIDTVWIPLQAFSIPNEPIVQALTWLALVFWTTDIFVTCNTMYYAKDGALIRNRKLIFWRYLTSWFLVDIVVVGVEWSIVLISNIGESQNRAGETTGAARLSRLSRLTRIFRIFRLLRLPKLRRLLYTVEGLIESEFLTIAFVVCKNLFLVLLVNHALACIWFAIGTNGWVTLNNMDLEPWRVQYLVALNWALAQFTPGASTVVASTDLERIFAVSVLALGMVLATCFISSITSAMASVWSTGHYHRSQAVLLRKFLHQQKLPRELACRITRYVQFVLEFRHRNVHASKVQYLELLSGPLQMELKVSLFEPHLTSFACLAQVASASPPCLQDLCTAGVGPLSYAKNDGVFRAGSHAESMIFVTLGSVAYRCGAGRMEHRQLLELGSHFREPALWMHWTHRGDMRAITAVDALSLNSRKFGEIVSKDGRAYFVARMHAFAFWRRWAKAQCDEHTGESDGLAMTDVPELDASQKVGHRNSWRKGSGGNQSGELDARAEVARAEELQALFMDWTD